MTTRTVDFLERTAKTLPDRDIGYRGVVAVFGSIRQAFAYYEKFPGGAMRAITREDAEALLAARQS